MSELVQFVGMIGTQNVSETRRGPGGPGAIDKSFVSAFARAHEYAGFDRVLIGYFSFAPDGFQVAAYAAHETTRLKFLLAHRPGFTAPTLAARQLASLDQFIDGRLAVHIITGGSDAEQARDGDYLDKAARYARTDEYMDVMKKTWTSSGPFDHIGKFYRVEDSFAGVRCVQAPHIPVFFGGSSPEAIAVAGKHADDLSELLEPMFLLNGMLKEDVEKSGERWFSPAEEARLVEDIQENLPVIVQTLYNFWRNKRSGGTVRNEEPKSGRNDPCPCGSGRKYKQCCGRPDKLN